MKRDLSINMREARHGAAPHLHLASGGGANPRDVAATPSVVPHEQPAARAVATRRRGPEVLSRNEFVEQIEREKRRAERSRAPFSMVLFENDEESGTHDALDIAPTVIAQMKRDTDIVGELDDNVLAALLPGTDAAGARCFLEKTLARQELARLVTSVVTYPDHLFDSLTSAPAAGRPLDPLSGAWATKHGTRHAFKRAIDILGALAGITLLSPLMLLTAIGVAATSAGPIIFKQVRLGRGGRTFVLYKFRSMFRDADERVHRDYVLGLIAGGHGGNATRAWAKLEGDARVTPLGRFIRRTCLDELPQLFNVLKGDLSLVGPRPPLPYEAAAYDFWHLRRVLEIKPGITGMWQVEGRNVTTFDEMVRMDLRYVRTWSLLLDLKIICKTIVIIIKRNGVG
jgi:lipopolysaccharide/colanic/teichoic acid biosynthesis glycosyltransferase